MNGKPGEGSLLRIAREISDGRPVDWDTEERLRPELAGTMRWLRTLETLSRTYGAIDLQEEAAGGPRAVARPTGSAGAIEHWGPLQVLDHLGGDAGSDRYRAFDPALQREVVLELWREEAGAVTDAALGQLRRLVRLGHANVLPVHGVERFEGRAGIWTDVAPGEALEARLARGGVMERREAAAIGIELCRALGAVHDAGLAHGDVRAAGVFCPGSGRVVLGGFGPRGTPGPGGPDRASDLRALGLLLQRMVTAGAAERAPRHPEAGANRDEPVRTARSDPDTAFARAVAGALDQDPRSRHADAAAMERALREALERM